jgi:pre-mRNA-splicing factor SYF1
MYPILEHDIPYELEIIKNPYELGPWLRYIQFKQDRPLAEQSFVFERACTILGRSYKLWKMYLDLRVSHLKRASYQKYPNEFHKVNALYEKALVLLNKMPRLWTDYLEFLLQQQPDNNVAQIRRTFNRALQALPITQHHRIWSLYIEFANSANPLTTIHIWERYVMFQKDKVEEFIQILVNHQHYQQAAERLMQLLVDDEFVSANGKSRFQLYQELLEILIHHSPDIEGINIDQVIRSGIEKYTDQKGLLYVNLATYWINQGSFENARDVMEEGISNALTVRDFTQIFDSYAEFEENLIARMMTDADANEVDRRMESFEQLMDRRPFILNDVLLRITTQKPS